MRDGIAQTGPLGFKVETARGMGADALEAGMRFRVQSDDGLQIITVVTVKGDTVTVDRNHPLAGMTLNFDVTIVDVRDSTGEELDHGHAHSPGAHGH